MTSAEKIEMATLNDHEAYGLNLRASRRLVTLQRQWIDDLEAHGEYLKKSLCELRGKLARTEPVVAAAREYCEWRRQRGEPAKYLASVVGSLMKAVRAAGKTD